MKKKAVPREERVVPQEILEAAKRATESDKIRRVAKCSVCGSECPSSPNEVLCWVCRRLKISAWRDSDIQMNAQE